SRTSSPIYGIASPMLRANRSTRRSSGSNTQLGDSGTNRISLTRFTSTAGVSIWLLRPLNSRKRLINAANHSADYQTLLGKGLTRSLVAVRAQEGSTRTVGYT